MVLRSTPNLTEITTRGKGDRWVGLTLSHTCTDCLKICNNGCTNAPQFYVIRTLPVFLLFKSLEETVDQDISFLQVSSTNLCIKITPIRATCFAHFIVLDFMTRTSLGGKHRSRNYSLPGFLHSPVTCSILCPNVFLSTLFSNTLSLCLSFNLKDGDSRPYKTSQYTEYSVNPTRSFWLLLSIRHTFLAVLHTLHTL
jgi:hypothetical protein